MLMLTTTPLALHLRSLRFSRAARRGREEQEHLGIRRLLHGLVQLDLPAAADLDAQKNRGGHRDLQGGVQVHPEHAGGPLLTRK